MCADKLASLFIGLPEREGTPIFYHSQTTLLNGGTVYVELETFKASVEAQVKWLAQQLKHCVMPEELFRSIQKAGEVAEGQLLSQFMPFTTFAPFTDICFIAFFICLSFFSHFFSIFFILFFILFFFYRHPQWDILQ